MGGNPFTLVNKARLRMVGFKQFWILISRRHDDISSHFVIQVGGQTGSLFLEPLSVALSMSSGIEVCHKVVHFTWPRSTTYTEYPSMGHHEDLEEELWIG